MDIAERFNAMLDEPGRWEYLCDSADRRAPRLIALGRLWAMDRQAQIAGDQVARQALAAEIIEVQHELGLGDA
ncbi:MAG: hypothetical protein IT435_10005 [Phycisphaerales bacterium]|nr:hypothetical protein [Phycisphaerales bacterium]